MRRGRCRRIFNLDFDTLLLEIKQKLTASWELEDKNAADRETRGPIQFLLLRAYIFHRRLTFYLNIKLLSSYVDQPLHIFQLAWESTVKTSERNLI